MGRPGRNCIPGSGFNYRKAIPECRQCNRKRTANQNYFLYEGVEWDWYRRENQNVLYWHWSPDKNWTINLPVRGWNEALMVYLLAAASPTHTIPKIVYDNGWANNGNIINGNVYEGITLPWVVRTVARCFITIFFSGFRPAGFVRCVLRRLFYSEPQPYIN